MMEATAMEQSIHSQTADQHTAHACTDTKQDIFVIGIAGGSASGKTTIINKLRDALGDNVIMISHDYYYWSNDDKTFEERVKLNYDHPNAFETEKLIQDIKALKKAQSVEMPIYDFATYTRKEGHVRLEPKSVVIVEGILILENKELRDLMDMKVYIDTEDDERLMRRILRDTKERGRSVESILSQYAQTVRPMHKQFVEPSKRHADLIIPRGGENTPAINLLIEHLHRLSSKA